MKKKDSRDGESKGKTMRVKNSAVYLLILVTSMILMSAGSAFGLSDEDVDGNAILEKMDRNLNPESFEAYRKLVNMEPNGRQKEFVLYTVKKGTDKVAALFLSPASEKGRSTLRLDENMWLYIPNVAKPIRITSLQSVVGGVLSNFMLDDM